MVPVKSDKGTCSKWKPRTIVCDTFIRIKYQTNNTKLITYQPINTKISLETLRHQFLLFYEESVLCYLKNIIGIRCGIIPLFMSLIHYCFHFV